MKQTNPLRKYVLSGGPGNGKSTLGELLRLKGEAFIDEAPRIIIDREQCREAVRKGYKGVFPDTNLPEFERLVLEKQLENEAMPNSVAERNGRIWLDRSLIDIVAYCERGKIALPEGLAEAIEKAGISKVYILEPLTSYENDRARHETREEAMEVHKKLKEVYERYSKLLRFEVQYVPDIGLEARAQLLLAEAKRDMEPEFHSCMQFYNPVEVAKLKVTLR